MNNPIKNILTLPKGMLLFLAIYALSFPALWLEIHFNHHSILVEWLGLSPALVWKGQVWRAVSYALLAGGILAWAINLFWFATLMSILRNDWSSSSFWIYCLVAAIGGALPLLLIEPHADVPVLTAGALIFALLVAWDRFYRRERILMLGIGEVSVRQGRHLHRCAKRGHHLLFLWRLAIYAFDDVWRYGRLALARHRPETRDEPWQPGRRIESRRTA